MNVIDRLRKVELTDEHEKNAFSHDMNLIEELLKNPQLEILEEGNDFQSKGTLKDIFVLCY